MEKRRIEDILFVWTETVRESGSLTELTTRSVNVANWRAAEIAFQAWLENKAGRMWNFAMVRARWQGGLEFETDVAVQRHFVQGLTLAAWLARDVESIATRDEPQASESHLWGLYGYPFTDDQRRNCAVISATCRFEDER